MRNLVSILLISLSSLSCLAESDHIILRNGQENDVTIFQVSNNGVVYSHDSRKGSKRFEAPAKDIYMIYISGQGNVYFTLEGDRLTGEQKRVDPDKNDVIYMVTGAEIAAENIRVKPDEVCYDVRRGKGRGFLSIKKGAVEEVCVSKDQVFMIRYKKGTVEIITPIDVPNTSADEISEGKEPEFMVIFHEIKKGESLEMVARQYKVLPDQLKEWNDFPASTKQSVPMKAGTQIMIYQPKK